MNLKQVFIKQVFIKRVFPKQVFPKLQVILLIIFISSTCFSQITDTLIFQVNDYIKSSAPFLNGFVFSTPRKLYYIDAFSKKLSELNIDTKSKDTLIISLCSYSNYLFVATTKGILVMNNNFSVIYEINEKDGLKDLNITSMYADKNTLYIGTRFRGIYTFNYVQKILDKQQIDVIKGLVDNYIRDIKILSFDKVISSFNGFSTFDYVSLLYIGYSSKEYPILSGTIQSILPFGDTIFIGTSLGLIRFDRKTEQIQKLSFSSAVFSMEIIGKTLILATYEGIVFFDIETGNYEIPTKEILREPVASTVSVNGNKIFVGFDNKKGTFSILEYQKPFLKIQNIKYTSKDKVLIQLYGNNISSIKKIDLSLNSLNITKSYSPKPEIKIFKDNVELSFSITNFHDDTYLINIDYFYENKKETVKDIFVVKTKISGISFNPVPLFINQSKINIIGKIPSLTISEINVTVNGRESTPIIEKSQDNVVIPLTLSEGTNDIKVILKDFFNNLATNSFTVIVDTTSPTIISVEGNKIIEKDNLFSVKIIEPFIEKIAFSESIKISKEESIKDGKEIFFPVPNRNIKTLKVIAYDKAGNVSSKDFELVFSETTSDILISQTPETTENQNFKLDLKFKGKFKRVTIYHQGIPILSSDNIPEKLSTNVQLQPGKNIIRIEGIPNEGNIINKSILTEYITKTKLAESTEKYPLTTLPINTEIERLKRENEELKRKIEELENAIKKLSQGKTIETTLPKVITVSIESIPSLIKVPYSPDVDNFSKISKKLYGSESFSVYFYYLFKDTKISKLISEKGYIIAPNKKLMEEAIKTRDISIFSLLSAIIEWEISKELNTPKNLSTIATELNVKYSGNTLKSEKGLMLSFYKKENNIVVNIK